MNGEYGRVRALIDNPLELNTVIDVKSYPLSRDRLLENVPDKLKKKFVGGSGLSYIMLSNTYHHYYAPIDGVIRHSEIVRVGDGAVTGTYGVYDFPNWALSMVTLHNQAVICHSLRYFSVAL